MEWESLYEDATTTAHLAEVNNINFLYEEKVAFRDFGIIERTHAWMDVPCRIDWKFLMSRRLGMRKVVAILSPAD